MSDEAPDPGPPPTPPPGPPSPARRRVLLTLGFGAATGVALSRVPKVDPLTRQFSGAGGSTTTTAPTLDPPALEGADPAPAAGHTFDIAITGGRVRVVVRGQERS